MELRCCGGTTFIILRFENGVILYGSQASFKGIVCALMFENGVILYGSQALVLEVKQFG